MDLRSILGRARRGLREDLRLYVVAVTTLTVAFLCLSASLLGLSNVSAVAERWGESQRMTLYLRDGAQAQDVEQLRLLADALPEVREVTVVTAAEARAAFLSQTSSRTELAGLPPDVFPASLELTLAADVAPLRVTEIATRLKQLSAVEDIETYAAFFAHADSLLTMLCFVVAGLALLVGLCVLAVVSNTIRLAVANRRDEIEVLKLCGATHEFVRGPFVVEGAFQGFAAALIAELVLFALFLAIRGQVDDTFALLTGGPSTFLPLAVVIGAPLAGAMIGATGSALSLRRYLTV